MIGLWEAEEARRPRRWRKFLSLAAVSVARAHTWQRMWPGQLGLPGQLGWPPWGDPGWVNRSSVVLVGQSGVLRVEEGRVSVARQPEEVWGRPMRPRPCVPPRPPGPSRTPPAAEAGKPTLVGVWDCQARPPLLGSCGSRYCHCCPGRPRVRHPPWRLTCGGSSPSGWSLGQGSLGQEGLGRKARCK